MDPQTRVLLLEAGPSDFDPLIHIPLGIGKILQRRLHDWGYQTEAEAGLKNRRIPALRGKVLGGCSSVNVTGRASCGNEARISTAPSETDLAAEGLAVETVYGGLVSAMKGLCATEACGQNSGQLGFSGLEPAAG